jgi:hypothetical protein
LTRGSFGINCSFAGLIVLFVPCGLFRQSSHQEARTVVGRIADASCKSFLPDSYVCRSLRAVG